MIDKPIKDKQWDLMEIQDNQIHSHSGPSISWCHTGKLMAWGMIKRWHSSRQWISAATSTDATLRWTLLSWRALGARSKTPTNLHNQGEYRRIPAATARKMHSEDQMCSRANQPKWPHHCWRKATISGASEAPTTKTNRNKTRNRKKFGFSDSVTLDKAKLEREELKEKQKRTLKRKHKKISQSKHNHTALLLWRTKHA